MQKEHIEDTRRNERLLTERDSAENRARVLSNEMIDARRRIGDRDQKYEYVSIAFHFSDIRWRRLHEAATRFQVYR